MYYLKRIAGMIPLLIVIAFLSFVLVRLAPGGPFDRERVPASPEVERQLKAKYHLDEPVWKQFARYLYDLAHADLGPSLKQRNHSVNDIIGQALPISLTLGGCAFSFAMGVGIPLGFWAGMHKGKWHDRVGSFVAISFICVPALVIAPLAVMVFAIKLRWFPVALAESPMHFLLPTVTLGIYFAGRIARLMREGMAGVLDAPFLVAARAKGLSDLMACVTHAFPIAVLPVLSYSGPLLADLLTGSFVVENVFQIPGLGIFIVNSALAYDYTLIVGLVLLYAALLLVLNFLVDLGYSLLDPRVRYD
jgi:oligopeptide transport system permease protein